MKSIKTSKRIYPIFSIVTLIAVIVFIIYAITITSKQPQNNTPVSNNSANQGTDEAAEELVPTIDYAQKYAELLEYSKNNGGLALIIMKNNKIVIEDYHNGYTKESTHTLASGTKSFSGVILVAMIEDGYITSFDEQVSATITEWKNTNKADITYRQLLGLTSGIDAGQNGTNLSFANAIKVQRETEAGTFVYGPNPFQIFGEAATRVLKAKTSYTNIYDYFKDRVLNPAGITIEQWAVAKGTNDLNMASGVTMSASQWLKFGQLLYNRGKVGDTQIISSKLITEIVMPSQADPAYGIAFWTWPVSSENKNGGLYYMASGAGNQRLYIFEPEQLVLVRQGVDGDFNNGVFFELLQKTYD